MTTKNHVLTQNDTMGDLVAHEDGHFTNRMAVTATEAVKMGQFVTTKGAVSPIDLEKEDGKIIATCAGVATANAEKGEEVVCISGQVTLVANHMEDAKTLVATIKTATDAKTYKTAIDAFKAAVANMKRFGILLVLSTDERELYYPNKTGEEFEISEILPYKGFKQTP